MIKKTFALGIEQQYYALKSKKKIKHGPYRMILKSDTLVYGQYNNNQKVGTWECYNQYKDLEFIYDYSSNRVIDWNCQDKHQRCRNSGTPASYSLGLFVAYAEIASKINYPESAAIEGRTGSPIVNVVISKSGVREEIFIGLPSGHVDIDKAAYNAVKSACRETWIPAKNENDTPVGDTLYFKLNFVL